MRRLTIPPSTTSSLVRGATALDAHHRLHRDPDAELETHKVPGRGRYDEAARRERLAWIRHRTGSNLDAFEEMRLVPDRLARNLENGIGAVEIPVGLAGPLLINGDAVSGIIHAPFATTEGALVASACRGATAISRAGGVTTRVLAQRMTRAPAFEFSSTSDAMRFVEWLGLQLETLRACCREVSRHASLLEVESVVIGRSVHTLFVYETGDAAGQNMTTATTWHACQWILAKLRERGSTPERFLIEANLSSDKKVNLDALFGSRRGWNVTAECVIDAETCQRMLKVSPAEIVAAHEIARAGGEHVGMIGYNVNVANVVAAMFVATGQDIACVHESSLAELTLEEHDGSLLARIALPGLVLGTVGGGTHLPGQQASLRMLGCQGPGSARRLAEIVAGFCLALDISTFAAVTSGEFATAHERLGRNRPVEPMRDEDFDAGFFEKALRMTVDDAIRVTRVSTLEGGDGASILTELTARRLGKRVGLLHRRVHHTQGATDVVVKVKPLDAEVLLMMQSAAAMCGRAVADAHARFRNETGFSGCHLRELAVYAQTDRRFTAHVPRVYGSVRDDAREAYVLVLERLTNVRLLDSADDPQGWGSAEIEAALRGIGAVHAIWMNRERELLAQPWIGLPPTAERMTAMTPLWEALAEHASEEFPALVTPSDLAWQRATIHDIPRWWGRLESMPRTLVHNDFNPRNIALRVDEGRLRLCAYDWELATMRVPQHDAAELLAYVLPAQVSRDEVAHYVELHRCAVAESGGAVPDSTTWREGFALSLRDLLVNRFALYLMAHSFRHYGFLERSLRTLRRLVELELEVP